MADELRDSLFLGDRVIRFVRTLLSSYAAPSAITDFERRLLSHREDVRAIDASIRKEGIGGLPQLLEDAKDFVPPHTAMRVLLYAKSRGFLRAAHEMVYLAGRDEIALADEEINQIITELRKNPDSQVFWLMLIYAGDELPQYDTDAKGPSVALPQDFR